MPRHPSPGKMTVVSGTAVVAVNVTLAALLEKLSSPPERCPGNSLRRSVACEVGGGRTSPFPHGCLLGKRVEPILRDRQGEFAFDSDQAQALEETCWGTREFDRGDATLFVARIPVDERLFL